jgi:hypothetical protein
VFDFQPEEREREQEVPVGTLIDGGWRRRMQSMRVDRGSGRSWIHGDGEEQSGRVHRCTTYT